MKKTIENLQKNGFKVVYAKNKKEALSESKKLFKEAKTVGIGGSESVSQIGLLDWMGNQLSFHLFNQYEAEISMEESNHRRQKGIFSDLYVTSSNAISESGFLINVDGSGNRVAAQSYGPQKVLLIVGKNKIVKDIDEGFERIEKIAAPKNVERINKKALSYNKPPKYTLKTIQNIFCVIKRSNIKDRIIILLVDEELGY